MGAIQNIKNFFGPLLGQQAVVVKDPRQVKRDLSNYISPVQLQRIKQDFQSWREAITEAELAWYPQRVKMQRIFVDTVLNGHVESCMSHRKDLTLLRDYKIYNAAGDIDKKTTALFQHQWFKSFINYGLDAQAYGYSLVSLGDIINDTFPKLKIIKRWNVSPDRFNVTAFVYSLSGAHFLEDPYRLWHIYIPTESESGVSPCGFGYLYKVALYEIVCRNLLGQNATFTELYSQPYRVGKTPKTTETERGQMEEALINMGSNGWAVVDTDEVIEFIETKLGGTGWQGYENLEQRCEKKISKIILGHADAMDSVPGKLGNDGKDSPAEKAKKAKQAKDSKFIESLTNEQLIPRMQEMGVNIPPGSRFAFTNDDEKEELREREDKSNKATAEIAKTMKDAGLEMDAAYFMERTGIPATKIITQESQINPEEEEESEDVEEEEEKDVVKSIQNIQNKIKTLYSK